MVNGLCLLESVQGVGFSYCIPNKVHTILANDQKQIFLYAKNAQFASKKRYRKFKPRTDCNIYGTFCFTDQDFSDLIIFQTKKNRKFLARIVEAFVIISGF